MAEKYRFMDAVQLEDGQYDREYNAQDFTDYFKALVTTGVLRGAGNQLVVSANGSNMATKIDTGIAFILGRYYENDSFKEHMHDTETLGNSRIDRIVIRMDLSPDKRNVLSFIKKGVPSPNPVPPALTQTTNIYEISLAQVKIVGGQTFIATNAITDERGRDVICPWAGSNILPSFNDNALSNHIANQQMHVNQELHNHWNNAANQVGADGRLGLVCSQAFRDWDDIIHNGYYMSPSAKNSPSGVSGEWFMGQVIVHNHLYLIQRVVKFADPSLPTFERARVNGVWQPWVDVTFNKLFQSVSNGKTIVNQAVTDMGVYTAPDAPFATTAANIRQLSRAVSGTGTITSNGSQTIFAVSGLGFTPQVVMFRARGGNINAYGSYNRFLSTVDYMCVIGNNSMGGIYNVFDGGFDFKAAYPGGTGVFDWWAIK